MQQAKMMKDISTLSDLVILKEIRENSMILQAAQNNLKILQAEADRRIAAGDEALKKETEDAAKPGDMPI